MLSPRRPFRASILLATICCALAACGLTARTDFSDGAPDAGTGGAPDADIDPDNPCLARLPITEPAESCAYPVAPVSDPPELASVLSLRDPSCQRYRLGTEIALPFEENERYAFSFDVNGDSVGDIFFYRPSDGALKLAVSEVSDGVPSYRATDCTFDASLEDSLDGSRSFVRDINGDSIPDLVVGVGSYRDPYSNFREAFRAWVNLPTGFVKVFEHRWPEPSSKTTLLDVAVADFDNNGACLADIAFGYDRVFGEENSLNQDGLEWGGLVALMDGTQLPLSRRERKWAYVGELDGEPASLPNVDGQEVVPVGELAAGAGNSAALWIGLEDEDDSSFSGILIQWDDRGSVEQLVHLPIPVDVDGGYRGPYDMWIASLSGIESALVLVGGLPQRLLVYDLDDLNSGVLVNHAILGSTSYTRVFGGGPAGFSRALLDMDGDGDVDFIEGADDGFAIHRNENGGFASGTELEVTGYTGSNGEHPFIAASDAEAALIVNNASGENGDGPPTVQPIECAP